MIEFCQGMHLGIFLGSFSASLIHPVLYCYVFSNVLVVFNFSSVDEELKPFFDYMIVCKFKKIDAIRNACEKCCGIHDEIKG